MRYQRRYVQFNDLVIDNYDMLSDYSPSNVSTKVNTTELSYGNGSYVPFKDRYLFYSETPISMTLKLEMKKIPCSHREFYRSFVITELSKPGRLWAIQNNELVWTYAVLSGYAEQVDNVRDILLIDVDFVAFEGVWHKANKQKTFIREFTICDFLDCLNYKEINPCWKDIEFPDCCSECAERGIEPGEPCECDTVPPRPDEFCECCECDSITKHDALCYNKDKLQEFYGKCNQSYKIIYSCDKALEYFTDEVTVEIGQMLHSNPYFENLIDGSLYVDTDVPTSDYKITLYGIFHNPYVEVNGQGMTINGDYDGYLYLYGNGDVVFKGRYDDCCDILIEPEDIELFGEELGFTFTPRYNRIHIDTGCCVVSSAYFDVDSKTI